MNDRSDLKVEWDRVPTDNELAAMVRETSEEVFFFIKTLESTDTGVPECWLGGQPTLPDHIEWPVIWDGADEYDEEYSEGPPPYPMHFVAQVDLARMPSLVKDVGLPASGTLFFFLDPFTYPSGQAGLCKACYEPSDVLECLPREMPNLPGMEIGGQGTLHGHLSNSPRGYKKWSFGLKPFVGLRQGQFENRVFDTIAGDRMLREIDDVHALQMAQVSLEMSDPVLPRLIFSSYCGT